MAKKSDGKSGKPKSKPRQPMSSEPTDISWDDDTVPRLDFDDAGFDRVTTIPELPPELLAKRMMDHPSGEDDPQSGMFGRGAPSAPQIPAAPPVPSLPTAPSVDPDPPVPFELERAVFISKRPGVQDEAKTPQNISTAPPPPPPPPPPLPRPAPASARSVVSAASLELDLSGFDAGAPASISDPALRQIADRYATGDYSGALVLAEGILENFPEHTEAQRYAQNCRDVLMQMYSARLGSLNQRVSMSIPSDQIRWLSLDHRAGFLLSLVDGNSSVEELLDISGMPRLDALRIMYSLFQERVVALTPRDT